jgi:hypothetical protein
MGWDDRKNQTPEVYPDQRPGSAWFEEREEKTRQMIARQEQRGAEHWRDKAARLGIDARSFDDLNEKIDYWDDQCKMAQIEHAAESKLTDAQLAGVPEPDRYTCAYCGHEGTAADLIEPLKLNGGGLGEWVCRPGVGCRYNDV